MKGIVYKMNSGRGMVALKTENGFSVFELTSGEDVNIGDEFSWSEAASLGETLVKNVTQGESYSVYFQNHYVSPTQVDAQLRIGN